MSDLAERFHKLDELPAPDLWPQIEGYRPGPMPPTPGRRPIWAIGVGLLVAAVGIGSLLFALFGGRSPARLVAPGPTPTSIASRSNGPIAFETTKGTFTLDHGRVRRVGRLITTALAWSPNGKLLAYGRGISEGTGEIDVVNLGAGTLGTLVPARGADDDPAWSPSGQQLAFTDGKAIDIANLDALPRLLLRHVPGLILPPSPSPVGASTSSGVRAITHPPGPCDDLLPAWASDGKFLAFYRNCDLGSASGLYIVLPDGRGLRRVIKGPSSPGHRWGPGAMMSGLPMGFAWSPDGRTIAIETVDGSLYTIGASGRGAVHRLVGPASTLIPFGPGGTVAYAPDGRLIAFSHDGLALVRTDGSGLRRITHAPVVALSWAVEAAARSVPGARSW